MTVITRIYDNYTDAREACDAVNALNRTGVEASVLGNESIRSLHEGYTRVADDTSSGTETGAGIGAAVGGGAGLLAGLGMLAIPGLGPVVAAGWLAATAVGAVGGAVAGGAIGAITDLGVSEEDAPVYSEAVRRGGVLVSARFPDDARYEVENALSRAASARVEELRRSYEAGGWRADSAPGNSTYVPPVI
jgi:hypothetical protein